MNCSVRHLRWWKKTGALGWFRVVALVICVCAAWGIDLFEAGKGGYLTHRITGLVTLADKTILAYAEARKDGNGDWADIDILMR